MGPIGGLKVKTITMRGAESSLTWREERGEKTMTNADIRSLQSQTSRTCHLENNPPENCKNILGT